MARGGVFWRPSLLTADDLSYPCDHPEVVFHLGGPALSYLKRRLGVFADIMRGMAKEGVIVTAVPLSEASRAQAAADDRFHIFFHSRMQGPRYLNFKSGYLPDYYFCDPNGFAGFSTITDKVWHAPDRHASALFRERLFADYVTANRTKIKQEQGETEAPPEGAIAVFLQTSNDVVLQLKRFTTQAMVRMILGSRLGRPVVLKRHPSCNDPAISALLDSVKNPRDGIFVSRAPIHQIIASASAVACINSGVGFEALLHGKPVLLFGGADYHHVCRSVADADDLTALMSLPPVKPALIDAFLDWYLNSQMISARNGDLGAQVLARIEAHYFHHGGFFERDGVLLEDTAHLADIPGVIVQGRYDMVTPPRTAWELSRVWPGVQLNFVADAGHAAGEPGIVDGLVRATDMFARRFG